jgi:hypothetical protein
VPEVIYLPFEGAACSLAKETRVLFRQIALDPAMTFGVHTLDGNLIGNYEFKNHEHILWELMKSPELVNAIIDSAPEDSKEFGLKVLIARV